MTGVINAPSTERCLAGGDFVKKAVSQFLIVSLVFAMIEDMRTRSEIALNSSKSDGIVWLRQIDLAALVKKSLIQVEAFETSSSDGQETSMDSENHSLKGKRILITGADRGIGAALGVRCAAMGANVCINVFSPVEMSGILIAEMTQSRGEAPLVFRADIRDPSQIEAMFAVAHERLGGLDVLINNAGVESIQAALELPVDEWDRIINTNLRGSFLCSRQAARTMKNQQSGGVVLNISSIHDTIPRLGTAHYCASKAGLTMLTRALAQEWAEYGIRVVGISPGAVETTMNGAEIASVGRSQFETWIPMSRLGHTDDICDAAMFLISDKASYISGATLVVDGAYSLNGIQYDLRTNCF